MKISEEKEKYLKYYFENIHFMGELMMSAVSMMSEFKGQGAEYVSCSYDSTDDDYMEGFVTLFFWKPAVDEDTIVFVKNEDFFQYLLKVCKAHILKCPEDEGKLINYISKIKNDLS